MKQFWTVFAAVILAIVTVAGVAWGIWESGEEQRRHDRQVAAIVDALS